MGPMVSVERVSHRFGAHRVLKDVTLHVRPHELLCVVGQSGCGKTTLLRIVAGLLEPESGTVAIDGEEVVGPSPKVAMVFQHFGLFPWRSVRANIAYGLANRGRSDAVRVDALIRLMGLEEARDRYPHQLSGGMRQRVGLARALAVEPDVLLMDEPFGSLDAITREQLQEELLRIWERDRRVTGVFITHDIDEAILVGDRVAVLPPAAGPVCHEVQVAMPRPRTAAGVRSHPDYPALRRGIRQALRAERTPAGLPD